MKWTKERIIEEINKYEYLSDFKKNTQGCHRAAVNMGLHDELNQLKKQKNNSNTSLTVWLSARIAMRLQNGAKQGQNSANFRSVILSGLVAHN